MAPVLQMGRVDVSSAVEEEFNAWYNTVYITGYLAVPGCMGARRYVAVEGQPKYLTRPSTSSNTPKCRRARLGPVRGQAIRGPAECSLICAMTRDRPAFTSAFIRNNGGGAAGNLLPPGHENPRRPTPGNFSPGVRKSMPILRPRRLNSIPSLTATSRPARPNSET